MPTSMPTGSLQSGRFGSTRILASRHNAAFHDHKSPFLAELLDRSNDDTCARVVVVEARVELVQTQSSQIPRDRRTASKGLSGLTKDTPTGIGESPGDAFRVPYGSCTVQVRHRWWTSHADAIGYHVEQKSRAVAQ